ncbi:MAG: ABC transporter ATP-binding protein [Lachnospiraceae bacterium]|nr:ABC transporter ATP-binding protein [Lachnospiraceae bacterium]
MSVLEFKHVYKSFPGMSGYALDDITLSIEQGEFVTILGSSGCGKTTLIKTINRLVEPDSGEITLFGESVKDQDPVQLRRKIGYVIQQIGLFPHMTVAGNIATIPKILKWDKEKTAAETDRILSLMNLPPEEFKNRYPSQLSGGQQQRVGLARAMICDPKVMLLDEPFGAIDAINRDLLQNELKALSQGSEKTYLFVTHDIREAFKLGTKTIIMEGGKILQYDSPLKIAAEPADDFVRELLRTSGMTAEEAKKLSEGGK